MYIYIYIYMCIDICHFPICCLVQNEPFVPRQRHTATHQTCPLYDTADTLAVSHIRHTADTQQTCLLRATADMSAV